MAAMARTYVAFFALVLSGCSDGQGEDLNGDGIINRIKWSGERCPPYSVSPYPKNGYCYPG